MNVIRIEIQDEQLDRLFSRLIDANLRLRPLMADIAEVLVASTRRRFDTKRGPDGVPWEALAPETIAEKIEAGVPNPESILERWGYLRDLINSAFGDDFAEVSSSRVYAATHQFGRGGIPARPFIGLSPEDLQEIVEAARDYEATAAGQ